MQRKAPQHQQVQRNPRYNWNQYRPGQRPPNSQAHRNFSRGQWTRNYYAHRQYRGRPYVQPRGWFSRHWAFGMVLPRLFWTQHYWIADYADFGLANPPYGYVWVRYDNDALLVNVESGEILQAVYGLFNG
ncbi:MAG: RcnB family protein [Stellaceae bacterium]